MSGSDLNLIVPDLVEIGAEGKPRLIGGRCEACGAMSFPRTGVCASCLSEVIEAAPISSEGILYSYAVVHQAPAGWNVPYTLAYVDLSDGLRVLAHIEVGAHQLAIDLPVQLKLGIVGTDHSGAPLRSYVFGERE